MINWTDEVLSTDKMRDLQLRSIPLIDVSNAKGTINEIERACRDVGFMYITGHAIAPETIAQARQAVVDYFALPLEVKLGGRICQDNYRGYIPTRFFNANSGDVDADNYEGYKLHFDAQTDEPICAACDLYGPNKWPQSPPHFRVHLLKYWHECDRLSAVLLHALAEIIGTSPADFLQLFESPLTNMTLLHYPPQAADATGFGIHPHKDTDALTILAADPVGGLMVRCRDEQEWIRAEACRICCLRRVMH